ncbi:UpxY family transcription antiterminator [Zobellia sp. 1_MG-2023]|uniref:UpxY family transcription antiterminator n=1 Tax=Zobellia sp. 1_MG-2023 TaxID=3062626 RepID=UPI0026E27E84|nr:UpxY family transcription antiterminator [Zobellia sp. 1_MG-2023]MDO6817595.1 UpxY family transcription antiterminator [Zobellia sp. 1_MG-2023]
MEQWYVLKVRQGYEKKVTEGLTKMDIQVYCPIVKEVRFWSDRKKTVETPLIKSYVFIKSTEKNRSMAFSVHGVERYLFWLGKPAIVRNEEIEVLKDWVSNDAVEELMYSQLQPGDRTTIRRGLLKDQEAVVRHIGKTRVSLVLEDMGIVVNAKLKEVV